MADRSRYRYVNFTGGQILESREMDKLQDITRGVDDNNVPSAFDLDAIYRDGALLNTTVAIAANTRTVTLTPTDPTRPMLIFVRGRWESLKTLDAPPLTLAANQSNIYLNWQLRQVTASEDTQLTDVTTGEATATMGELDLQLAVADDSARSLNASVEFEKNTAPIIVLSFDASMNLVPASNVQTQALATSKTGGLVKLTTDTAAGVAVSTDDVRLSDQRTPADNSVVDVKVRTPLQDGLAVNADATPRYDLTKDVGGISTEKLVHQRGKQLVADVIEWCKLQISSLSSLITSHIGSALGSANSHPMPTASDVGATPASHQGLALGVAGSHPPTTNTSKGGFSLNRTASQTPQTGDAAYGVFEDGGLIAGFLHDGDTYTKQGDAQTAAPGVGFTSGPLGLMSILTKVVAEHVNQTAHKNPHGLALADIGGASTVYVDAQDAASVAAANAHSDAINPGVSLRREGAYLIIRFAPNNGNAVEIAYGTGLIGNGAAVPLPALFSYSEAMITLAVHQLDMIFGDVNAVFLTLGTNGLVTTQDVRVEGSGRRDADGHPTAAWTCLAWRVGA